MISAIRNMSVLHWLGLLALLAAGKFAWDRSQPGGPAVIKDPVYAEMHVNVTVQGRTLEQVIFVKMASYSECEKDRDQLERLFGKTGLPTTVKSADCTRQLTPRQLALFDDQPTSVTYLSIARGARAEREIRMIVWGVSVAESNLLCDSMLRSSDSKHQGKVSCIRAVES
jgi:hypothetical protein